jgi:hypothetical protein
MTREVNRRSQMDMGDRITELGYAYYADAGAFGARGVVWPDPEGLQCSDGWVDRANGPTASGFMGARNLTEMLRRLLAWAEAQSGLRETGASPFWIVEDIESLTQPQRTLLGMMIQGVECRPSPRTVQALLNRRALRQDSQHVEKPHYLVPPAVQVAWKEWKEKACEE